MLRTGFTGFGDYSEYGFQAPYKFNDGSFQEFMAQSWEAGGDITKALLTGDSIVTSGASGGQALRTQALSDKLQMVSYSAKDSRTFRIIPKKKAQSTVEEWSDFQAYGGPGDGFVGETGYTGAFDGMSADDNFVRQTAVVKFLATVRQVGLVAQRVKNIVNPITAAETGATLNLIQKANIGFWTADAQKSSVQYNGFFAQIRQWLDTYPTDQGCLIDMGGQPIDQAALNEIQLQSSLLYGNPSLLISSAAVRADLNKALFGQGRYLIGNIQMGLGTAHNTYTSDFGEIKLEYDIMLRAGLPLVGDGPGVNGYPRGTVAASGVAGPDAGSTAFTSTPFASCAAIAAGTGLFWDNFTRNTDTSGIAAPALPTGGTNSNQLAAASYLYGLSIVVSGLESAMWVYGAGSAGTVSGATAITVSSGDPIVKAAVDLTTPCISGLGTTPALSLANIKFRLYRAPSTATSLTQFALVGETGCPTTGNANIYDNGFCIPGSDNAIMVTEQKNGVDGWGFWQLLPILKRELPWALMADNFGYLLFGTPIFRVPRHQVWIRNIGRWTAS